MEQLPLVDVPRSRTTDPETSHTAGDSVKEGGKLRARQVIVKAAVSAMPGLTATELAERLDGVPVPDRAGRLTDKRASWWRFEASRRLAELDQVHVWRGPARECNVSGTRQATWWPSRRAAEVAAARSTE